MESISPHILVLDDDIDIRRILTEYLSEFDFRISAVTAGREMLSILEQEPVDLLCLDLRLPGETGLELGRLARECRACRSRALAEQTERMVQEVDLERHRDAAHRSLLLFQFSSY